MSILQVPPNKFSGLQSLITTKKSSFYHTLTTSVVLNRCGIIHGGTFVIMKLFLPHTYPFVTQVTPRYALRHSPFRAGPTLASRDSGETYLAKLNPSHLVSFLFLSLFHFAMCFVFSFSLHSSSLTFKL